MKFHARKIEQTRIDEIKQLYAAHQLDDCQQIIGCRVCEEFEKWIDQLEMEDFFDVDKE